MLGASRPGHRDEGLTLIELLIVMLIIGVLAAIAIPSFLDQQGKASDTTAKEVARTASLAAETFSTEHSASYAGISPAVLQEYDRSLQTVEGKHNAYLKIAEELESGKGYVVTAIAPQSKDTFTITRNSGGELQRTCTGPAESGGCRSGTW
jgi:type IV pilus assembly protein PilA